MPKPIYMTPEMIEESFKEVREDFEAQYAKLLENASKGKLANGRFKFDFPAKDYFWDGDDSRASLVITPEAFSKTMLTILKTDKEVGWHGLIHRDSEDRSKFILDDIILYPQAVTGATIDADESQYPLWTMKLPDEQFNAMRFHGHSHVNMATNPSGVDMDYRERLIAQYKDGFYVFMIINKKLEMTCQIYDFDENTLYDTTDIDILIGESDMGAEMANEYKVFVTTKSYGHSSAYSGSYPGVYTGKNIIHPALSGFNGFLESDDDDEDEFYWRGGSKK